MDIMSIVALHTGSMGDVGKREAMHKQVYLGWPLGKEEIGLGTLCLSRW